MTPILGSGLPEPVALLLGGIATATLMMIDHAVQTGRVQTQNLRFANDLRSPNQFDTVIAEIATLQESQRLVALFRAQPEFQSGDNSAAAVRGARSGRG